MRTATRSSLLMATLGFTIAALSGGVAWAESPTDQTLQQMQAAETATREAQLQGSKKPAREIRKADKKPRKQDDKTPKKRS